MPAVADALTGQMRICTGQNRDRALTVALNVNVSLSGLHPHIAENALRGELLTRQRMDRKVRIQIAPNARDQRNLTAKPGCTDRLIRALSAEGDRGIQNTGRLTGLRDTVDAERIVDIDTSYDDNFPGAQSWWQIDAVLRGEVAGWRKHQRRSCVFFFFAFLDQSLTEIAPEFSIRNLQPGNMRKCTGIADIIFEADERKVRRNVVMQPVELFVEGQRGCVMAAHDTGRVIGHHFETAVLVGDVELQLLIVGDLVVVEAFAVAF